MIKLNLLILLASIVFTQNFWKRNIASKNIYFINYEAYQIYSSNLLESLQQLMESSFLPKHVDIISLIKLTLWLVIGNESKIVWEVKDEDGRVKKIRLWLENLSGNEKSSHRSKKRNYEVRSSNISVCKPKGLTERGVLKMLDLLK